VHQIELLPAATYSVVTLINAFYIITCDWSGNASLISMFHWRQLQNDACGPGYMYA